jgi:aminoglycoside phosphotransferase (APT) family kinase protein
MDTPEADIALDRELVTRLIAQQHPDLLARGELRLVANGWDNALYRLGHDYCIRLPRRSVAAELVANEQRWLPAFARRVSVPLPVPVRVGRPSDAYPWPWSICPWFEGTPVSDVPADRRSELVPELAEFIAQLHTQAPAASAGESQPIEAAPYNPVRGVPLAMRSATVLERLATGVIPRSGSLLALWNELVETPVWRGPALWLHADLHPANLLMRRDHPDAPARLAAVLDFGDLTAGDPATDLAAGWLVFDQDARAEFRTRVTALTGADDDTWRRARGWALSMATAMALHSDDNPRMASAGRHTLEQVLLDA